MTSHVARLYAVAAAVLGLFLAWAGVAAAPWQAEKAPAAAPDPTAAVLAKYEKRLRRDARLVHRIVEQRAAQPLPSPPVVRILPAAAAPPVATTKTS